MNSQAIQRIRACFRELSQALGELVDGDDWVDQKNSPLGRRLHCEAARTGRLRAKKLNGRWLARRADVDTFIEQYGTKPPVERPDATDEEMKAQILAFRAPRRAKKASQK